MCGILAVLNNQNTKIVDECELCLNLMKHRGPDHQSACAHNNITLGHCRLSIIDLDSSANQPFIYENLALVYNGEIFNYQEIKTELELLGNIFETKSDTEVVIKAYAEWGANCFKKFNGMWTLVIHDRKKDELIISRDRFGQKPLFFYRTENRTIFSSEINPLLYLTNAELNINAALEFLHEGSLANVSETFYKEIFSFPKSEYWIIDKNNEILKEKYWTYPSSKNRVPSVADFEAILEDAISLRLQSDVEVGFLLSGGLDSTVIAEVVDQISKVKGRKAFTYSDSGESSELKFAKQTADKLDFNLLVSNYSKDFYSWDQRLKSVISHLGRGHSSTALVAVDQLLEQANKNGIKVLLDGQGADELLLGYKDFQIIVALKYFLSLRFKKMVDTLGDIVTYGIMNRIIFNLKNLINQKTFRFLNDTFSQNRFIKDPKNINRHKQINHKNDSFLYKLALKQHTGRLENLLYYGDIISMKHSIENRSPFLDHRLVEYIFECDDTAKFHSGIDKYLLRKSKYAQRYPSIVKRKKEGFPSAFPENFRYQVIQKMKNNYDFLDKILKERIEVNTDTVKILNKFSNNKLYKIYQVYICARITMEAI
ncbi:asparagine synthase (glutamine-hydrolyzing) [Planktomarina temperata]|nr:asparagine synthase (glutamine-hydrolyzing) [Planktomarina temperata]